MVIAASDEQRLAARGVSGYGGERRDRVRGGYVSLASARLSVVCSSVLWPIVLLSRGLVLSTLIESSAATILVQLAYIGLLGAVLAIDLILGRVRCLGDGFACFALMALHTVLFCLVLTNPMMPSEYSLTQSALLFVLVIGLTAYFIRTREIFDLFVRLSFYTIGGLLAFCLLTHLGDLNLCGVMNIMSSSDRMRSVFGFGQPNSLGGACFGCLVLYSLLPRRRAQLARWASFVIAAIALAMLLCQCERAIHSKWLILGLRKPGFKNY